jgi:hypothetical protein
VEKKSLYFFESTKLCRRKSERKQGDGPSSAIWRNTLRVRAWTWSIKNPIVSQKLQNLDVYHEVRKDLEKKGNELEGGDLVDGDRHTAASWEPSSN